MNFKFDSYNDEKLFLEVHKMGILSIEKCSKESNNLKCEISRKNLDILANTENELDILYIDNFEGSVYFNYVGKIKINYKNINKEYIYFKINKLTYNEVEYSSFVSFEANVTNIEKIKTTTFDLRLTYEEKTDCFFIKHDKINSLYLSCYIGVIGSDQMKEIEGFELNNIHYKYNFIFETQNINETIHSTEPFVSNIVYLYPETLDFTSKDSIEIYFFTTVATNITNLRLNENGEDLVCTDIEDIKKCIVTKEHFKNKESGYYFIYHKNNINQYITIYYSFGAEVTLPPEPTPTNPTPSGNSKRINNYSFGLLVLLSFLII